MSNFWVNWWKNTLVWLRYTSKFNIVRTLVNPICQEVGLLRWPKTLQMYKILTRFAACDSTVARKSRSRIIIIHIDDPVLWRKVYLDYSNNLLFTLFTFSGQNFSAFTQCMYLFKANTLTLVFKSSISSLSVYIKGSLISEDVLTLVQLPEKIDKFCPWAESLNFLSVDGKQLIQIFCSGARFGTFFWKWDQSQNTFWD